MSKLFRPGFWKRTQESVNEYRMYNRKRESQWFEYPTYAELKKDLPNHFKDSLDETITVYRSRRGEWGEWFEHWELRDNKAIIIKSGWS